MYITSNLIECFPEKVLTCKRNRLTEIINYQTVKIPKRHKIRQVCVPPKSRHFIIRIGTVYVILKHFIENLVEN